LCKYCVYKYANGKIRLVETISGMCGWGDKAEWWKGDFKYDIFIRTFVNATMYPYPTQQ
jgi:hypothetical protein